MSNFGYTRFSGFLWGRLVPVGLFLIVAGLKVGIQSPKWLLAFLMTSSLTVAGVILYTWGPDAVRGSADKWRNMGVALLLFGFIGTFVLFWVI